MNWRFFLLIALGAIVRASAASAYLIRFVGCRKVQIDAGTYPTGTLYLKSNVERHLARNSTVSGSIRLSDYPERPGLILADVQKADLDHPIP
jgi:polygalacturonase